LYNFKFIAMETIKTVTYSELWDALSKAKKNDRGRVIDSIVIHCTATPKDRKVTTAEIDQWHKGRGFSGIGYHFVVHQNGEIDFARPLSQVGAHCKTFNKYSIGVAYVGGLDGKRHCNTMTEAQDLSLFLLVNALANLYNIPIGRIYGHNDINPLKSCPCFNVNRWYVEHLC